MPNLGVVPIFVGEIWCLFLALRDLMLFSAGVDQTAKLSAVVLTSGGWTLTLPFLHSSYSPNHKPVVLDLKPSALSRRFLTDVYGLQILNKPETETSQT